MNIRLAGFLGVALFFAFGYAVAETTDKPPVSLESDIPHVMIFAENWVPDIKLYETRELSGPPVFHLSKKGLYRGTHQLCSWPGGDYDTTKAPNMVLGYDVKGTYTPCSEGSPILSTWGDGGTGTAVIYISVADKKGSTARAVYRGKNYYLDLQSIPQNAWEWLKAGDDFKTAGD